MPDEDRSSVDRRRRPASGGTLPPEASTAQRAAKEANPSSNPLLRAGRLAGLLRAGADERVWASGSLHR